MSQAEQATPGIYRLQMPALVVGVLGLLACGVAWKMDSTQFFHSYLVAFSYITNLSLGCLSLLMIGYLSGGQWTPVTRKFFEAASKTLPLVLVFFIPIFFGIGQLFPWAQAKYANDPVVKHKIPYMNWFSARVLIYFGLWMLFFWILMRWAKAQDEFKDTRLRNKLMNLSGAGLMMLAVTLTFSSTDWIMSLDPHWYSTMMPVVWMDGGLLLGMAFTIAMIALVSDQQPFGKVFNNTHLHDLGKLLLAFTMFWAYCSFSQLLITYSGNLREETPWYLSRYQGGWGYVSVLLLLFHFFVPFFLLLSRSIKRNRKKLIYVALLLLLMRYVDLYWWISPLFGPGPLDHKALSPSWVDAAALVGLGGIWFSAYLWFLKGNPLLPVFDPYLEAMQHHGE